MGTDWQKRASMILGPDEVLEEPVPVEELAPKSPTLILSKFIDLYPNLVGANRVYVQIDNADREKVKVGDFMAVTTGGRVKIAAENDIRMCVAMSPPSSDGVLLVCVLPGY